MEKMEKKEKPKVSNPKPQPRDQKDRAAGKGTQERE
jgi:hypothetical protein